MSGYLPAGVTDAHPHFNPPGEVVVQLECEADEVPVVPSFKVKEHLNVLQDLVQGMLNGTTSYALESLPDVVAQVQRFREQIEELEDNADYDCPWKGELELPAQQAEAEWDCPVCGTDHKTDTVDDGPDPDDAYEAMREARYDD